MLADRVSPAGEGVAVELNDGGRAEGEELLVAIGRAPRTEGIGLDSAGVEPGERGFLETDDRLRVGGREWLYAVGDVNGRALFTHMGKYQAWVAAENVLGREVEATAEAAALPRVTFTDPQVAAVGRTLAQAQEAGIDAKAIDVPTDGTAGASFYGKGTGGTSRLVIDEKKEDHRRRDVHGFRDGRLPTRGNDRDRRQRCQSIDCATRSRPTRPAARSGSSCSKPTGCRRALRPASDASGLQRTRAADLVSRPARRSTGTGPPARGGPAGGSPG